VNNDLYVLRKYGAFYRPNRCGYTMHIEAAGHYTKTEAEAEVALARFDTQRVTMHPLSDYAQELAQTIQRAARLMRVMGAETELMKAVEP